MTTFKERRNEVRRTGFPLKMATLPIKKVSLHNYTDEVIIVTSAFMTHDGTLFLYLKGLTENLYLSSEAKVLGISRVNYNGPQLPPHFTTLERKDIQLWNGYSQKARILANEEGTVYLL